MFDTFQGLPVHALIVHAVVVLLPLLGVLTPLVAWRASWRERAAVPLLIANVALWICTIVAEQSGEKLASRLYQASGTEVAKEHSELGEWLPRVALLLIVASVIILLASRHGGVLVPVSLVVAVASGVAVIGLTAAVGHSGAEAVWKDTIANTPEPKD